MVDAYCILGTHSEGETCNSPQQQQQILYLLRVKYSVCHFVNASQLGSVPSTKIHTPGKLVLR